MEDQASLPDIWGSNLALFEAMLPSYDHTMPSFVWYDGMNVRV